MLGEALVVYVGKDSSVHWLSSVVSKAVHPVECRELGLAIVLGHRRALSPCASRKILLASVIPIFGLFVVLFVPSTSLVRRFICLIFFFGSLWFPLDLATCAPEHVVF